MSWQVFKPHSARGEQVSLSKYHFTMSPDVAAKLDAERVLLYYNDQERKIKLKKADREGYKVTKNKVSAKRFREHFGIEALGAHPCEYDEKDEAIIISLD